MHPKRSECITISLRSDVSFGWPTNTLQGTAMEVIPPRDAGSIRLPLASSPELVHNCHMFGPQILVRTMSVPRVRSNGTQKWQYHPRSDHHSKVACWGILFDLLRHSPLLQEHVRAGKVAFGINHTMVNFTNGKKKDLDLVVCRPAVGRDDPTASRRKGGGRGRVAPLTFREMVDTYAIELSVTEKEILESFPDVSVRPVGSVLMALEAKAAMTEFAKARPRLYDELQSSQVTVHADTNHAIAVGLALINGSETFVSPTANPCIGYGAPLKVSKHAQPRQLDLTIKHLKSLPRRANVDVPGFDALAVLAVDCKNDGKTPVTLIEGEPAPQPGDAVNYDSMINRTVGWYASRFPNG